MIPSNAIHLHFDGILNINDFLNIARAYDRDSLWVYKVTLRVF